MVRLNHALTLVLSCSAISLGKETVQDAARISRKLLASDPSVGVMATIFPSGSPLQGEPYALQEYYASCYANGSLSLITMPISRHTRNIQNSPSHAASLTVWTSPPAARKARVSLIGNVTFMSTQHALNTGIQDCYLERHPDAKWWLPDDPDGAHTAYWARFDPHVCPVLIEVMLHPDHAKSVYFVGGFGTTHYIGDVPLQLYQDASLDDEDQWQDAKQTFLHDMD